MDTGRLKTFAQKTRTELMGQVSRKLDAALAPDSAERREAPAALQTLEGRIAALGKAQVIEQAAYTWFNRFTALRYMDVNGYLTPMVVTPAPDRTRPELLDQAAAGAIPDHVRAPVATRVRDLLEGRAPSREPQVEAYRLLLVATCNHLNGLMPFLFEAIADYTELLMPDALLAPDGWVAQLRDVMTEEACRDVEIIGWLYQFYISEKKDQVFASLKKNQKITAENIPAATQLFTPHWIVRYLVENSLGRLWLLNRPGSKLAEQMDYYIAPEEAETDFLKIGKPEEIKVCDPACGSGHMLTYAFDLLYAIYEEEGYDPKEIPTLILKHNLTGIEIDDRAGALAAFALAMKAAAKLGRRRFLRMEVRPDIVVLQNVTMKLSEFNGLVERLGYTQNIDKLAAGIAKAPLVVEAIWKHATWYLDACTNDSFIEQHGCDADHLVSSVASEVALYEEGSRNPFLLDQYKLACQDLLRLAKNDEAKKERKEREGEFRKVAQAEMVAQRLEAIGREFERYRNDTTYRMDLNALEDRLAEAASAPDELARLDRLHAALTEAVRFHAPLWATLTQFEQAKNFGSLIVPKLRDPAETLRVVEARDFGGDLLLKEAQHRVVAVLRMAEALSPKYNVVVANPPYMNAKGMNPSLKVWTNRKYFLSKADLMTMFMERAAHLARLDGYWSMINIPTWMFLDSFASLRESLIAKQTLQTLVHLGRGIFGSDFGTVAFTVRNCPSQGKRAVFRRLFHRHVDVRSQAEIEALFHQADYNRYEIDPRKFITIPGTPFAYWANKQIFAAFENYPSVKSIAKAFRGISTGDNERFSRFWHEVSSENLKTDAASREEASYSGKRWFPYNRGGSFRKWFGLGAEIIDYEDGGRNMIAASERGETPGFRHDGSQGYFLKTVTWGALTAGTTSFRRLPMGYVLGHKGPGIVADDSVDDILLQFLNSRAAEKLLGFVSPTLDTNISHLLGLPFREVTSSSINEANLIELSKSDWDAYETSWDFTTLPLLSPGHRAETLAATYARLRAHWQGMTDEMQRLEEENNRIFIDAYGLQDELTPQVPIEEITLTCNPAYRYGVKGTEAEREVRLLADTMKELISYAIGCMFGRYSLDAPGLILANQGDTQPDYLARVPNPTFRADKDNLIPLLEEDRFEDDAFQRFREFMAITFGEGRIVENLEFMRQALGKEVRTYLAKDFFADHVQRYKKRPIYWPISSPRGAFQALIYMHRYTPDTLNIALNDYVRSLRDKLEASRRAAEALRINPDASAAERNRAGREIEKLTKQIAEITEWERDVLYPLAVQRIRIDLDDGVKRNYPKLAGVLKPIKGLEEEDA